MLRVQCFVSILNGNDQSGSREELDRMLFKILQYTKILSNVMYYDYRNIF